jgi:hypothetical protein
MRYGISMLSSLSLHIIEKGQGDGYTKLEIRLGPNIDNNETDRFFIHCLITILYGCTSAANI